jgi:F-type H+-transporting ATPase subunit b
MLRLGILVVVWVWLLVGNSVPAADDKAEKHPTPAAGAEDHHDHAEQHAGHGHDTTDVGHGNGSDKLTAPDQVSFDLAVGTFVVFALLVILLGKFAWGPISAALDQREQHVADMIATAEKNARESEARLHELEKRLAEQAEATRVAINEARREGELQKEQILAEAAAAAQQERDRAVADIRDAKNAALREIAQQSVNTAVGLAKNILRREVQAADHEQLITDALAQFHARN